MDTRVGIKLPLPMSLPFFESKDKMEIPVGKGFCTYSTPCTET